MSTYETVIGLEVHAQLRTRSKAFCDCSAGYGGRPNSRTCPICLGHPGALPVLNGEAVRLAVTAAAALGATIHTRSLFARKNYFYPDLPKGYQISQHREPLATGGSIEIEEGGVSRRIGLTSLHLEEDAGKSIHDGMPDSDTATYIDLNRAGLPLVEIVSEPEIRSPHEAFLYLRRLRGILRYTGVCEGNMEEGSLRCDANISVRPTGEKRLGTRTELKNLNSFRNVQRALEYEAGRHLGIIEAGGSVARETVLWDEADDVTRAMRDKEEVHDYRYFPEPDLPPLVIPHDMIEEVLAALPPLPAERRRRLMDVYGRNEDEANILTRERGVVDFYEEVADASGNPDAAASFIINDLPREQKSAGKREGDILLSAAHLSEMIRMIDSGAISFSVARQEVFEEICRSGKSPGEIVRERSLEMLGDEETLARMVRQTLESHPEQVESYRQGKKSLFEFFVGQVMKLSQGRADPVKVAALLEEIMSE